MQKTWEKCWVNAQIVTCNNDKNYGIIHNAALAINKNKITWIGPTKDLPNKPDALADQVIDVQGQWITPALIDSHTHLIYGGNRAHEFALRLQGISYEEIARLGGGILSTVKATRAASAEQLLIESSARLKSMLAQGVTALEIKSGYGLDLKTERKMLRVARQLAEQFAVTIKTTFLGAHALPPEFKNADDYIDHMCKEMLPALAEENLVDAVDVFCEKIGFSLPQTEKVFLSAQQLKLPIKCHAEQLSDLKGAKLAAEFKALSVDHLEYLSEDSIKVMAKNKTVAVLLPGAFYFIREKKLPPIDLLREYKIPIAIATDCNPGTSPTTSLLLMLNMACTLFRLTPEEAFLGITRNAAHALNLQHQLGSLEVGKNADFIVWNIKHPDELSYYFGYYPLIKFIGGCNEQSK